MVTIRTRRGGRSTCTHGERYAFYAADGETPIAGVAGAAQYLMAIHVSAALFAPGAGLAGLDRDGGHGRNFSGSNGTDQHTRSRARRPPLAQHHFRFRRQRRVGQRTGPSSGYRERRTQKATSETPTVGKKTIYIARKRFRKRQ